jgi:hypothetical protein
MIGKKPSPVNTDSDPLQKYFFTNANTVPRCLDVKNYSYSMTAKSASEKEVKNQGECGYADSISAYRTYHRFTITFQQ